MGTPSLFSLNICSPIMDPLESLIIADGRGRVVWNFRITIPFQKSRCLGGMMIEGTLVLDLVLG